MLLRMNFNAPNAVTELFRLDEPGDVIRCEPTHRRLANGRIQWCAHGGLGRYNISESTWTAHRRGARQRTWLPG